MRRIGVLMGFAEGDPAARALVEEFRCAREAGWKEGNNLRIELRWGAGDPEKFWRSHENWSSTPDAILAQTTPVAAALVHETRAIPIVFVYVSDPIGSGFATNLARPGGNITGFTFVEPAMGGKWVGLLKEIAPRTRTMSLLFNPATAPPLKFYLPSIQTAASSFDIEARSRRFMQRTKSKVLLPHNRVIRVAASS